MNEFINTINPQKFRATNTYWNHLCLNAPWSVGYVSTLIEAIPFNSKEQWEAFYYQSGTKRNNIIAERFAGYSNMLNDHTLKKINPSQIKSLSWDLKNINQQFGRTKIQLAEKGEILYDFVFAKGINVSIDECIACVRFRTICETWNGIIIRERNTIKKLSSIFKTVQFDKTSGDFDHQFAVDYELKLNKKLICGIQIKPKSYTFNAPYLNKAKEANRMKNLKYKNKFGKYVYDVIAQTNGTILNIEIINKIKDAIQSE